MKGIVLTVLYLFIRFFSLTHQQLQSDQENVCRDPINREELHCCYNYFEVDGACQECENGTLAADGKNCKQCPNGFHGYRCLLRCDCSKEERCDHVLGCILIVTDFTVGAHDVLSSSVKSETEEQITDLPISMTSDKDFSTNEIFYYIFAIGVMIVILLVSMVAVQIFKCIRKNYRTLTHETESVVSRNRLSDQPYQGIYDEIDDTQELEAARNSYMSLQSEKINSETDNSSRSDNSDQSPIACQQQTYSGSFQHNHSMCLAINKTEITEREQTTEFNDQIQIEKYCVDENSDYITPIA